MKFKLHRLQYVYLDRCVDFHHLHGKHHSYIISMNDNQMQNLDDILNSPPNTLRCIKWTPLGGGIWLHIQRKTVSLVNRVSGCFFRFFPSSWNRYKSDVHNKILHKNVRPSSDPHRPLHDSKPLAQFRADLSQYRQRYSSFRQTRNARHAHGQRSQSTNVSRRKNTNLRQPKTRRGGKDATRTHHEIKDDFAKPANITDEDCESSSEYNVEEHDSPPDYYLE